MLSTDNMERLIMYPKDQVSIHITVLSNAEFFTRYPDSLLMALAKIGGLLALFKIGVFLRLYHRTHFESKIQ